LPYKRKKNRKKVNTVKPPSGSPNPKQNSSINPDDRLNKDQLLKLYDSVWNQAQFYENQNYRMISSLPILLGLITFAFGFLDRLPTEIQNAIYIVGGVFLIGIGFLGSFATCQNWYNMLERWLTLNQIHKDLKFYQLDYINPKTEFPEPENFGGLYKFFFFRIRNGIAIFYCMIAGLGTYFVIELLSIQYNIIGRLKIILVIMVPILVSVLFYLFSVGFLYRLYKKKLLM
jgi:hypothetical protein